MSSSWYPSVLIRGAQLETLEIQFKFEQPQNLATEYTSSKHFLKLWTSDARFPSIHLRRGQVFYLFLFWRCQVSDFINLFA